jgi:hypothetical protein
MDMKVCGRQLYKMLAVVRRIKENISGKHFLKIFKNLTQIICFLALYKKMRKLLLHVNFKNRVLFWKIYSFLALFFGCTSQVVLLQ